MIITYLVTLVAVSYLSFSFVDANFPFRPFPQLFTLLHAYRPVAAAIYVAVLSLFFCFYIWLLRQIEMKRLGFPAVRNLILATCVILFISFPAFSNDIFNYIATAKMSYFYRENPYVVMPIEMTNEPMLAFLHAANKVALYGPTWILLTFVPHAAGGNNLVFTIYAFKLLVLGFYLALSFLIWETSGKNVRSLAFFSLNPLVVTETLVSGHNDVVMMFLALSALLCVVKKRFLLAFILLTLSVFVKGATVILLPLIVYFGWRGHRPGYTISAAKIWEWGSILLLAVFFLSPLREELYPWYFIWPMTFIALLPRNHLLQYVAYGFTLGLPLRFAPYVYFGQWGGFVPTVKKIVTIVPVLLGGFLYAQKKRY